jgi:hypothetical protein
MALLVLLRNHAAKHRKTMVSFMLEQQGLLEAIEEPLL